MPEFFCEDNYCRLTVDHPKSIAFRLFRFYFSPVCYKTGTINKQFTIP